MSREGLKQINIRVPTALQEALALQAYSERTTVGELMQRVVTEYLREHATANDVKRALKEVDDPRRAMSVR